MKCELLASQCHYDQVLITDSFRLCKHLVFTWRSTSEPSNILYPNNRFKCLHVVHLRLALSLAEMEPLNIGALDGDEENVKDDKNDQTDD